MPLMLFEIPHHELSDVEITAILRDIIAGPDDLPRTSSCVSKHQRRASR
jgi:hypothetical protein